jgi:riboflavin-specific deaminase-like protein
MTHGLRHMHDAILIGSGTAQRDNPRLNVREWRQLAESQCPQRIPRPILLSSQLNLPLALNARDAIIFTNFRRGETQQWLAARAQAEHSSSRGDSSNDTAAAAAAAFDCIISHCATGPGGHCDLHDCLARLYDMGFRSVMVEGGGRVIQAFLKAGLVDRVVITVAPLLLGGYAPQQSTTADGEDLRVSALRLTDVRYVQLGCDIVVIASPGTGEQQQQQQQPGAEA